MVPLRLAVGGVVRIVCFVKSFRCGVARVLRVCVVCALFVRPDAVSGSRGVASWRQGVKRGSERQVCLLSIPSIFLRAINMSQTPSSSQASATSSNFLKWAQYEQARLTVLNLGKVVGSAAEKAAARDWVEEYETNLVRSGFLSFSGF